MTTETMTAQQVLERIFSLASKHVGTAEVRATVDSERTANTRFARNEISSTGEVDDTKVSIQVAHGKRHATISLNQIDDASLTDAILNASRLAKLAPEDPEHLPLLGPQTYLKPGPTYDQACQQLNAKDRTQAIGVALKEGASRKLTMAGIHEHGVSQRVVGFFSGLRASHDVTHADFRITARTADETGSGWAASGSHQAKELVVPPLVKIAADKAVRSAKPKKLEPGRYTVILEPAAVADLLGFFTGSLDRRRADEGRSFFSKPGGGNRAGETLFGPEITLSSDPTHPLTAGATFDDDGIALKPTTWIENGVLKQLYTSRFWAQKQGTQPTGRYSVTHLHGGKVSRDQMLKGVKKGVLITRFWYCRWVDPQAILVTGLTRDGVFLVENGQVTGPVNNFRFNESPVTMLKNMEAMSQETFRTSARAGLRVPYVRTAEFNLASISEAV